MNRHSILKFIIFFFLSFLLVTCDDELKEKKQIIRPVKYQQVFLSGTDNTRSFSGTCKSGTEINLSFRVSGILESIDVKVGQLIKKGDLLAEIDSSDAQLNYSRTEEDYNKTLVQLQTAESNLKRIKSLYENNNVSLSDYEGSKNQYAASKAGFESIKKRLNLMQKELGYYKLYSPITGIIAAKSAEKNENIQAGQGIIKLTAHDDIEITVGMPESFISRIKTGQKVDVKLPAIANKIFDGIVSETSYVVGSQAQTYPVTIKLTHPTRDIRPGMAADVTFNFDSGKRSEQLIVAANAVGKDNSGNFVFIVSETGNGRAVVNKRQVSIGRLTHEGFEITAGLQNGDLVVTAGISKLADGLIVKLLK